MQWITYLIMYTIIFVISIIGGITANAGDVNKSPGKQYEVFFKYGTGIFLPTDYLVQVKNFAVGVQTPIWSLFTQKAEIGLWADPHVGRQSSGYGSYSLGVSVRPKGFYAESFWGVSGITATDDRLSTTFEFQQNFGLGITDKKGRFIGLEYEHFSNAGIQQPNQGRDFLLLKVGVTFGN